MQHTPDDRRTANNVFSGRLPPKDGRRDVEVPLSVSRQQQSALETLAEASRRHGDYTSQHRSSSVPQGSTKTGTSDATIEQALVAHLQENDAFSKASTTSEPRGSDSYATVSETVEALIPAHRPLGVSSTLSTSPLVQAASAANQQLEQAQAAHANPFVDPQLRERSVQTHVNGTGAMLHQAGNAGTMIWTPSPLATALQTFGSISMPSSEPTLGFGSLQRSSKNRRRGRFDDDRRKEVSNIRKQGACIRCRMLKKPCSGDTPCTTCANVESARLWKGKCLRTRLADEFTLWSTQLFYTKAAIEVPAAAHGLEQVALPGRIEVRLFAESDLCVSFAANAHVEPRANTGAVDVAGDGLNDRHSVWLLDEDEDISEKIEGYMHRIEDMFVQEEPSQFMRSTLEQAQTLLRTEAAEQVGQPGKAHRPTSSRSCYTLQAQLLKSVVELWILTRLLTSSHQQLLQLRYDPTKAARHLPENIDWGSDDEPLGAKNIPRSSSSYPLIQAQVLAAIESRCSRLGRTVANELERRLLQRQQASRFSTFLSAVILLNCVERMTGLYRTYDTGEQSLQQFYDVDGTASSAAEAARSKPTETAWGDMSFCITDHPNFWPLEISPAKLWPQGPNFAELLNMLLRMRALPPKTGQRADGTLALVTDPSVTGNFTKTPIREQLDAEEKFIAAWLDPLQLRVDQMVQSSDRPFPSNDEGVEAWDMTFISKLLLPE